MDIKLLTFVTLTLDGCYKATYRSSDLTARVELLVLLCRRLASSWNCYYYLEIGLWYRKYLWESYYRAAWMIHCVRNFQWQMPVKMMNFLLYLKVIWHHHHRPYCVPLNLQKQRRRLTRKEFVGNHLSVSSSDTIKFGRIWNLNEISYIYYLLTVFWYVNYSVCFLIVKYMEYLFVQKMYWISNYNKCHL